MSYAGKNPRSRRVPSTAIDDPSTSMSVRGRGGSRSVERQLSITSRGVARPATRRSTTGDEELDWQHIAIFAAGAFVGAAVGAGAALLFAPQSGADARHDLARRGRHLRERTADAWDDLRDELRYAARRGRRKLGRALRERRERRNRDEPLPDD